MFRVDFRETRETAHSTCPWRRPSCTVFRLSPFRIPCRVFLAFFNIPHWPSANEVAPASRNSSSAICRQGFLASDGGTKPIGNNFLPLIDSTCSGVTTTFVGGVQLRAM
jgi:hypothetical protein